MSFNATTQDVLPLHRLGAATFSRPEHRLTYEKVANDLFDLRVRRQSFPDFNVIGVVQCETGEKQAALTHWPLSVIHHIRLQRPTFLIAYERHHICHSFSHSPPIRKLKPPEVVSRIRK